jgi:hypothetical protein
MPRLKDCQIIPNEFGERRSRIDGEAEPQLPNLLEPNENEVQKMKAFGLVKDD